MVKDSLWTVCRTLNMWHGVCVCVCVEPKFYSDNIDKIITLVYQGGARDQPLLSVQFLSFSCSFWQNLVK